ncbi:hypothetical protein [Caballeronia sp. LZ043]|uniref:hypothetical protein n=1 Tax=Caballeronia sp. LZ043 TaxID=3038569 RepID=UPI002858B9E3|nr:hypothetical protein [Caballeronia sp. LZ043]MDR5821951.1 hypothetical protein [Caballeronia sp. LZ043]
MSRELHNLYREAGGSIAESQRVVVREGSVELRLDDAGDDEVMLQRVLTRRDGSVVVQLLPVSGVAELIEFRERDPYREMLAQRYRTCLDAIAHRAHPHGAAHHPAHVSECTSELDVSRLMRAVCRRHGGTFALFHWLAATPGSAPGRATYDTHVILAACSPGWLQTYVRRVVTDPVLESVSTSYPYDARLCETRSKFVQQSSKINPSFWAVEPLPTAAHEGRYKGLSWP